MLLHQNRLRYRQQQKPLQITRNCTTIVRFNITICTIAFKLFLLFLVIIVPYRTFYPQPLNDIVLFVDGWKIGNLFQRHQITTDSNEQSNGSHINIQNDRDDNNDIDDDSVLAPTISPTIEGSTSAESSCSLKSQTNKDVPCSSMDTSTTPTSSYFSILRQSCQIPTSLYQKMQILYDTTKEQMLTILCYRPPVGIASIFVLLRFLARSKRYLYLNHDANNENVEDRLFLQKLQQRDKRYDNDRNHRSYLFSQDDVAYHTFGGIERIRTRLCLASLLHRIKTGPTVALSSSPSEPITTTTSIPSYNTASLQDSTSRIQKLLIQALSVSSIPNGGSSWIQYIYNMIVPLAQSEDEHLRLRSTRQSSISVDTMKRKIQTTSIDNNVDDTIIAISLMTGKVRLHDALLRLCRDRVLQTTYRLARTVEHWERRMRYNTRPNMNSVGGLTPFIINNHVSTWLLHKVFRIQHSIENDRLCLSLAKAAYTMEVSRLGEITALLMERPHDLDSSNLIYALKATEQRQQQRKWEEAKADTPTIPSFGADNDRLKTDDEPSNRRRTTFTKLRTIVPLTVRHFSKYSFRWKADGKGFLSIRKFDNMSDGYIDGESANDVLLHGELMSPAGNEPSNALYNDVWMTQANNWIQNVKTLICQVIRESLKASTSKSLPDDCSENDFDAVQQQWIENDNPDLTINLEARNGNSVTPQELIRNREQQYRSIVTYIDSSTTWRRIGEGEKIRLRDVFGMNDWIIRLDLLGIPTSILIIYLAHTFHFRVVVPYWSTIRQSTIEISRKAFEILEQRVWVPLKGIYDDVMNRSPSMMSALGLDIEETSLDHMLRDLNFGDGTPATRQDAIRKATEQYEHDLSHGLFANFARGRLIRLLLIQVQQLKVGMLSALETIDVLIVGNRIHFKVLAAIPAILIASYGTRYFFRGLYNIRAKDIRPISAVHNEMTQYLNKMEKILLLSNPIGTVNKDKSRIAEHAQTDGDGQRGGNVGTSNARTRLLASNASPTAVPGTPMSKSEKSERRTVNHFSPMELGEMILNTHRYLILLDFSSPQPFPIGQCDEIHTSLQQYFNIVVTKEDHDFGSSSTSMIQQMDTTRQVQWLHTIQQKHQELMKFV